VIGAAIRAIRPLVREINIAYLHWAMREICPAHRDVPAIVLRLRHLHDERRA
jgi:hypothetical protein